MRSLLVYYRVYTEGGALLPKSSAETGDPSVGRILGRSIAPPHTAASLKQRICVAEDIDDSSRAKLFLSCTARSAMDDNDYVSLLTGTGPGLFPHEPMALVGDCSLKKFAGSLPLEVDATLSNPQYGTLLIEGACLNANCLFSVLPSLRT
jgi:hypothetical protein